MKLIDKIEDFLEEGSGFKTPSAKNLKVGDKVHKLGVVDSVSKQNHIIVVYFKGSSKKKIYDENESVTIIEENINASNMDFSPTLNEKDHTKDAVAFMKDIKSKIDKSIKELENDGDIYDNGSVTPYLVMRMLDIKKYSWYKELFYK